MIILPLDSIAPTTQFYVFCLWVQLLWSNDCQMKLHTLLSVWRRCTDQRLAQVETWENFLCSSSSCSPSTLAGCKALRSLPFGKKTSMQLFLSVSISSRSGLVNVNANHRNEHLYFREKYSSVGWKQTKAKTSLCTQDSRIPWKMRTHTQEMPLCFKIKHIFATVRPKACGTAPNTSVDDLLNKQN